MNFIIIFILVALIYVQGVSAYGRCPDKWKFSPHSRSCYLFSSSRLPWSVAEVRCIFHGGHHISLHSIQEARFARGLAYGEQEIWLGAAQFGFSKDYTWTDGSKYNYESWDQGKRPAVKRGRKCVRMNVRTGKWSQSCCKVLTSFICQKATYLTLRGE